MAEFINIEAGSEKAIIIILAMGFIGFLIPTIYKKIKSLTGTMESITRDAGNKYVTSKPEVLMSFVKDMQKPIFSEMAKQYAEIIKKLNSLEKRSLENQVSSLKLSILTAIHHSPHEKQEIEDDFAEYKRLGGNGYIEHIIAEWRKRSTEGSK
jgi:hypothetical protein